MIEGVVCTSNYSALCRSRLQCGNLISKYSAKPEQNNFLGAEFLENVRYIINKRQFLMLVNRFEGAYCIAGAP